MKTNQFNIIKTVIFAIAVFIFNSFSNPSERHIGEWKGTDNSGKTASLVLDENKDVTMIIHNQVFGGKNFQMNGKKGEVKFEIDYSKNPTSIDFVAYVEDNGELKEKKERLKGILRFITDNKMELRLSFTGKRFTNFDPEDKLNTIVLERVTK